MTTKKELRSLKVFAIETSGNLPRLRNFAMELIQANTRPCLWYDTIIYCLNYLNKVFDEEGLEPVDDDDFWWISPFFEDSEFAFEIESPEYAKEVIESRLRLFLHLLRFDAEEFARKKGVTLQ